MSVEMEFLSDVLLTAGAVCACIYCIILSRKLNAFKDIEGGVGEVVQSFSEGVDDLNKSLQIAKTTAMTSGESLADITLRAENVARRLELLVASMHDLPDGPKNDQTQQQEKIIDNPNPIFSSRVGRI